MEACFKWVRHACSRDYSRKYAASRFICGHRKRMPAALYISDEIRQDAAETLRHFVKMGCRLVLLSGDRRKWQVATALGIEEWHAQKNRRRSWKLFLKI
ncbi:MAG: hypothetical protein R2850_11055 [Bacteroidia bacterium]